MQILTEKDIKTKQGHSMKRLILVFLTILAVSGCKTTQPEQAIEQTGGKHQLAIDKDRTEYKPASELTKTCGVLIGSANN